MSFTPRRIIWHHTGIDDLRPQLERINRYHKSRGFPISALGFHVGYHYLIESDGSIVQCRLDTELGAHDTGENLNSIGIALAGDFNQSQPTEAQEKAAARVVGELRYSFNIPLSRIEPHRWDDSTDCPGRLVADNWLPLAYLKNTARPAIRVFYFVGRQFNLL